METMKIINSADMSREAVGLTVILYGMPGVGKTTIAGQIGDEKRTLILDWERGVAAPIMHLVGAKRDIINMTTFPESRGEIDELMSLIAPYKYIVVDSLSSAVDIINRRVRPETQSYGKGYIEVFRQWDAVMKRIQDAGKIIIYIAHSNTKEMGDGRIVEMPRIPTSVMGNLERSVSGTMLLRNDRDDKGKERQYLYCDRSDPTVVSKMRGVNFPNGMREPDMNAVIGELAEVMGVPTTAPTNDEIERMRTEKKEESIEAILT